MNGAHKPKLDVFSEMFHSSFTLENVNIATDAHLIENYSALSEIIHCTSRRNHYKRNTWH